MPVDVPELLSSIGLRVSREAIHALITEMTKTRASPTQVCERLAVRTSLHLLVFSPGAPRRIGGTERHPGPPGAAGPADVQRLTGLADDDVAAGLEPGDALALLSTALARVEGVVASNAAFDRLDLVYRRQPSFDAVFNALPVCRLSSLPTVTPAKVKTPPATPIPAAR